ncbi:arsenate reductase [Burkholderia oklahomensis]|uniref:arsenate reductase n=1 Tax=Burkholderia oklahomensis TaxID=342113 RepID=UPI00016A74A9|nr:arsenate reductase [Burkholderia oklahomensis]AOI46531.1 hypothetical protein WI23_12505 [Burkholderia oklahomensis C6786]KUY56388.1 hypothetical protein WI23_19380 [Burkholderia oklahomensis C6786]MBI0360846.1 hypothetical protein [Burkholderia oklahomensis]
MLDATRAHPIPITRPFVDTRRGARLYRPSERVRGTPPSPLRGPFTKEGGEIAIDPRDPRAGR